MFRGFRGVAWRASRRPTKRDTTTRESEETADALARRTGRGEAFDVIRRLLETDEAWAGETFMLLCQRR